MIARIYVTPKKSVLDPQGKAVRTGLASFGFKNVSDVRVGRYLEVTLRAENKASAWEQAKEMCEKLLATTVIEDYEIEVIEE